MAMFAALNAFGLLRVSREGELMGLDLDQHGISAYPELALALSSGPTQSASTAAASSPKLVSAPAS